MSSGQGWQGRGSNTAWRTVRATVLARDAYRCQIQGPKCSGQATTVDHIKPWTGDPAAVPLNDLRAACKPCNYGRGKPLSPVAEGAGQRRPVSSSLPETPADPLAIRPDLRGTHADQFTPSWLHPLRAVPEDAAAPLAMTPPHPQATGSYGPEAEDWARETLGVTLRWWQRLALYRALEHREDGSLCWRTVILSCARRSGKSVLLYVVLMYRITHGFEPFTECVLTAGKMPQAKEIMRRGWRYADAEDGWKTRKANDSPEIETPDGDRILLRPSESTAGYSPSLGMCDEAWFVKPTYIDDDLAPSLLERAGGGQLWLVSTAHRRATSLMRTRITDALSRDDGKTLLLLWAAEADAPTDDPETWRAASPHWTQDRAEQLADSYARAAAGQEDAELDDPDPLQGFRCQFLNVWPLRERKAEPGDPITTPEDWDTLRAPSPLRKPDAAAVESWYADGYALLFAWRTDAGVILQAQDCRDLADVATRCAAAGVRALTAGASLTADPALGGLRVSPGRGRTAEAVLAISRSLSESTLRHTGDQLLTEQVLAVRTSPSADGIRLLSKSRADALKAAAWAIETAKKPAIGKPEIFF